MTNIHHTVFYIGITNNLSRRIGEHRGGSIPGFTQKYNITKLIYFEEGQSRNDVIAREKQLKGWNRQKKINLVKISNSDFIDLYEDVSTPLSLRSTGRS